MCVCVCVLGVFGDIQGFRPGQVELGLVGRGSCFDVSVDVLVLGEARLIRQRVVGKHGVVAGGAGAASVGEAGGILLCWGAQVQILLQKEVKGGLNEKMHQLNIEREKERENKRIVRNPSQQQQGLSRGR